MKPYHGRGGEKEQKVIRMLFTTDAGVMTTQHLELYNSGSTAIFFYWRVNTIHKSQTLVHKNMYLNLTLCCISGKLYWWALVLYTRAAVFASNLMFVGIFGSCYW